MNEYRVYATCLASYNNGILHGRWIDCGMGADHIREELAALLRESPEPNVRVACPECEGMGAEFGGGDDNDEEADEVECPACHGSGSVPSAEEWEFHGFEGFPACLRKEWADIDALADYAEAAGSLCDATERIDVLAVLRRHAVAERDRLGTTDNDTQAALAAVVKLMEEAGNVIEWISDYVPDGVGGREAELRELRTALAHCRGGAA